jgi:hypothetical protein
VEWRSQVRNATQCFGDGARRPDKVLCWRYATLRAETADGGSDAGAGVAEFDRQQYLRSQTRG